MLLHDREELDDDLGRGSDKHLALALALGVDDGVKGVVLWTARCEGNRQEAVG